MVVNDSPNNYQYECFKAIKIACKWAIVEAASVCTEKTFLQYFLFSRNLEFVSSKIVKNCLLGATFKLCL